MIVHPWGVPIAFVGGLLFGAIYRWVLARWNPDLWYAGYLLVVVLWMLLVFEPSVLPAGTIQTQPLLATGFALSYPLWYRFGAAVTFFLVGRHPAEGGSLWIYLPMDYTASFSPRWEDDSEE